MGVVGVTICESNGLPFPLGICGWVVAQPPVPLLLLPRAAIVVTGGSPLRGPGAGRAPMRAPPCAVREAVGVGLLEAVAILLHCLLREVAPWPTRRPGCLPWFFWHSYLIELGVKLSWSKLCRGPEKPAPWELEAWECLTLRSLCCGGSHRLGHRLGLPSFRCFKY